MLLLLFLVWMNLRASSWWTHRAFVYCRCLKHSVPSLKSAQGSLKSWVIHWGCDQREIKTPCDNGLHEVKDSVQTIRCFVHFSVRGDKAASVYAVADLSSDRLAERFAAICWFNVISAEMMMRRVSVVSNRKCLIPFIPFLQPVFNSSWLFYFLSFFLRFSCNFALTTPVK